MKLHDIKTFPLIGGANALIVHKNVTLYVRYTYRFLAVQQAQQELMELSRTMPYRFYNKRKV